MSILKLSADEEKEMREMLNAFPIDTTIKILDNIIKDLSEEEREFYKSEIDFWGTLGNQHVLINNIIDIIEDLGLIEPIMSIVDEVAGEKIKEAHKVADERYTRKTPTEYWSEEPTRKEPEPVYRAPGPWTKPEQKIVEPHPEEQYKDPGIKQKVWDPGPSPEIPEFIPDFESIPKKDLNEIRRQMQNQIKAALTGAVRIDPETGERSGQPVVPRPYVMEMVQAYLRATDPEKADQLFGTISGPGKQRDPGEGAASRSRFGYSVKVLLGYLFDRMSIEELYLYWNSIVNNKVLPWVNTEYVATGYGGGEMGANIPDIYKSWEDTTDLSHLEVEWPEEAQWGMAETPEWFGEVMGPIRY